MKVKRCDAIIPADNICFCLLKHLFLKTWKARRVRCYRYSYVGFGSIDYANRGLKYSSDCPCAGFRVKSENFVVN